MAIARARGENLQVRVASISEPSRDFTAAPEGAKGVARSQPGDGNVVALCSYVSDLFNMGGLPVDLDKCLEVSEWMPWPPFRSELFR